MALGLGANTERLRSPLKVNKRVTAKYTRTFSTRLSLHGHRPYVKRSVTRFCFPFSPNTDNLLTKFSKRGCRPQRSFFRTIRYTRFGSVLSTRAFKFHSNFVSNIAANSCSFSFLFEYVFRLCARPRGKSFDWLAFCERYENNFTEEKSSCTESCRHYTESEVYPRNAVVTIAECYARLFDRITRSRPPCDVSSRPFPDSTSIAKSIARPTLWLSVYLHDVLPEFLRPEHDTAARSSPLSPAVPGGRTRSRRALPPLRADGFPWSSCSFQREIVRAKATGIGG